MKFTIKLFLLVSIFLLGITFAESFAQSDITIQSLAQEIENSRTINNNKVILLVYTNLNWIGEIQDGDYVSHIIQGDGDKKFFIPCGETNIVTVLINPDSEQGTMDVYLIKDGKILDYQLLTMPGDNFNSSVDCSTSGIFQVHNSDTIGWFDYSLVGISIVTAIIIIMLIKNRFFIKQNNVQSSN